ncbi:Hypothetical protein PBC10988_32780 [Planctomycetales bacterium 10988]|nr:Hypothetical protein PBC10988_32780 [Planctomycetales bacterium 10988]
MAAKSCPHCGEKVYAGVKFCANCGIEVNPIKETEDRVGKAAYYVLSQRAGRNQQKLQQQTIAHVMVTDQLADGSLPNIKRLEVREGTFTVLYSPFHGPLMLEPGEHEISDLGVGAEKSFEAGKTTQRAYICTVARNPLVTEFVLPDAISAREASDARDLAAHTDLTQRDQQITIAQHTLTSLSMRTADDILGGATMQLVLRCTNPAPMISMLFSSRFDNLSPQEKQIFSSQRQNPKYKGSIGALFSYSYDFVKHAFGMSSGPKIPNTIAFSISMWDLWTQFRMEFAGAIIQSIRNETAQSLYDTVEVRDRVAEDISKIMTDSIRLFGMKVDRVSSFRFISPQYEKMLEGRMKNALDRAELSDLEEAEDIQTERDEIAKKSGARQADNAKFNKTLEAEKERHGIGQDRETQRLKNEVHIEQVDHKHLVDAKEFNHEQSKLEAAERTRMQLEFEKGEMQHRLTSQKDDLQFQKLERMMELQAKQYELEDQRSDRQLDRKLRHEDAEFQRRVTLLKEYAGLPEDSILTIAVAENPKLVQAYTATMKAKGQDEQLTMQKQFRKDIESIYGVNTKQTHELLIEAARQLGSVYTAQAAGKHQASQAEAAITQQPRELPTSPANEKET